jgi:hypothetical protein
MSLSLRTLGALTLSIIALGGRKIFDVRRIIFLRREINEYGISSRDGIESRSSRCVAVQSRKGTDYPGIYYLAKSYKGLEAFSHADV